MLISHKQKFIFIHIYKNAGTSITKALMPFAAKKWQVAIDKALNKLNFHPRFGPRPFPSHTTASEMINALGKERFESYFTFAIVRNPWDWQVSLYKYMLKNKDHHQHEFVKGLGSFDAYIRWRCQQGVKFQRDFIYSQNDKLLVDYVGKFERLSDDFQEICNRIGVSASLPKLNVSNEKPYKQYYTTETEEMVHHAYDVDIKFFGYEFC